MNIVTLLLQTNISIHSYKQFIEQIDYTFLYVDSCEVLISNINKHQIKPKGQSSMFKPGTKSTLVTRHRKKRNKQEKTQHRKLKQMSGSPPTNWGWTQVLGQGKQFPFIIRCPRVIHMVMSCWGLRKANNLRKKEKIHCYFRYGYVVKIKQIVKQVNII